MESIFEMADEGTSNGGVARTEGNGAQPRSWKRTFPAGKKRTIAIVGALFAVAACACLWRWLACGAGVAVGGSDAWKNAHGTHESFPWRIEDGKGFVYQGARFDDPCEPVVSRPDWVVSKGGRTYILYEVDPGDLKEGMFRGEYAESLWIGQLGEGGEVVAKIRLATGVADVSGVLLGRSSLPYVAATATDGSRTAIPLRFPRSRAELRPTGHAWRDYKRRRKRLESGLWDDWPGNGSGYAADWVSSRAEDALFNECRAAVEALQAAAPTDARRAELAAELAAAMDLAWEMSGDSSGTALNVHWGNVADRQTREQALEPFLRNWLEAVDHPEEWEAIRSASGTFLGESFVATNGIAVLGEPEWVREYAQPAEPAPPAPPDPADPDAPEEPLGREGVCHRLLRLAPERVKRTDEGLLVGFDVLDPWVMDSWSRPGSGEFLLRDGVLIERGVNLSH